MCNSRFVYFLLVAICLCALTQAFSLGQSNTLTEDEGFIETVKRFWKTKTKANSTTAKTPQGGAISSLVKPTAPKNIDGATKKPILPGQTRATTGTPKDACGVVSPCKNGGSCRTLSSGRFYCFCTNDYYGKTCENKFLITGDAKKDASTYKDHCASNPCHNNGECVGLRTTFYCRCKSPNYGTTCEKKIGKREIDIDGGTTNSLVKREIDIDGGTTNSLVKREIDIDDGTTNSLVKREIDIDGGTTNSLVKRDFVDGTTDG